jgi:hypothetical protein
MSGGKLRRWLADRTPGPLASAYRARQERGDKLKDIEWRLIEMEGRLASIEGLLRPLQPRSDELKKG